MTTSTPSAVKISPPDSTGKSPWLLVWLNRLLLLGIGGGLAWCIGTVLATLHPNPHPEIPLVVKMLERPSTGTPPASPSVSPSPQMSEAQTQQLAQELQQLQTQMKMLRDRTGILETTLGISRPTEPLETRLQAIALQLQEAQQAATPASASSNAEQPPQAEADTLKVTLPSDVLFNGSDSVLRPEANLILDNVISDLGKYQKATILVAAHTDDTGQADDNRELSFGRARAVEQYLSRTLGKQYHWVIVGYGATRPLVANDDDVNRQRNRRIEIVLSFE